MQTMSPYVMESSTEWKRLERKTNWNDSLEQLRMVGLRTGMRILDAGCGTGAVSRAMAEIVGPEGTVVGIDRSEERLSHARELAEGSALPITFEHRPLDTPPTSAERESFDIVWSRFVFEYLPNPQATLKNLLQYVAPGGTIVIGDLDCNGLIHHPESEVLRDGLERLGSALTGTYDPYAGRKIFNWFRTAALRDIGVHVAPYHLYAGAAPQAAVENWDEKFRVLKDTVVSSFESPEAYDAFAKEFLGHLRSEEVFSYTSLVLAWATKPY